MPFRSKAAGILDEADLLMLETVLAQLEHSDDGAREYHAMHLIQLFQSGMTDPDELLQRVASSELK